MYYDRTLSSSFAALLEKGGALHWLLEFVRKNEDLDFLIGKTIDEKGTITEWISVYRGLSRLIKIIPNKIGTYKVDADQAYKNLWSSLFGIKGVGQLYFKSDLDTLLNMVRTNKQFDRYYNNKKEGFYQNIFSRRYGINGTERDDFVIIDKEAVIGYLDTPQKNRLLGTLQNKYKGIQAILGQNNLKLLGKNVAKKSIGNELDFLALDKDGNLLLIEFKDGSNTSGIYMSGLQVGLYYEIFSSYPPTDLQNSVFSMLDQKKNLGLINPNWTAPKSIKQIVPVLIIANYNYKSSAKQTFDIVMQQVKSQFGFNFLLNLKTYNFEIGPHITNW